MARWLVNRREGQLAVGGMAELLELARSGQLEPGDLVQPPGASDWLYAIEIPELQPVLPAADDDDPVVRAGASATTRWAVAGVLLLVGAGGGFAALQYAQDLPTGDERLLDRVAYSELVVTGKQAQLLGEPSASAAVVGPAEAGSVFELLAKRGEFYRARPKDGGVEGWIAVDQVMPIYKLGDQDVKQKYDPLYNPDHYLRVQNASWMQLPEQVQERVTVFQFMLANQSAYDMTDLVMVARINDARGHDLGAVEFRVEGVVPADGSTMVGTIVDPTTKERRLITQASFEKMAGADPDLRLEYSDGVEVKMETADFTEASIDIVELRAIPEGDGA